MKKSSVANSSWKYDRKPSLEEKGEKPSRLLWQNSLRSRVLEPDPISVEHAEHGQLFIEWYLLLSSLLGACGYETVLNNRKEVCAYLKYALNQTLSINIILQSMILIIVSMPWYIYLGSSVAQESVYQTKQKKGDIDSAIGTSIRTTSRHHVAASNVSQMYTIYHRLC